MSVFTNALIVKKIALLMLVMIILSISLVAQSDDIPSWRTPNRKFSFYEIQADFNNYWQGKTITNETPREERLGWKQFKRWEYFWQNRVSPTGEFPPIGIAYEEYLKYKASQSTKKDNPKLQSNSSWIHLGPKTAPGGYEGLGRLNCVVEDPNFNGTTNRTIWVGAASGGIWKTTDAGSTWTTNTDQLAVLGIGDIVIDPNNTNTMYVATGDGDAYDTYSIGVLKSTDAGNTWNTTGFQRVVTNQTASRRLIMSHGNSNVLFLAASDGLYRTTDAGTNWSQSVSGSFYDVKMHPTNSNIVYAATGTGFYRTTNGGTNWTQITSGIPSGSARFAIAVTPNQVDYVFLLSSNGSGAYNGVYRSTDAGVNFTTRSTTPNMLNSTVDGTGTNGQGWYDLSFAVDPSNANNVLVGGVNIWKSTDGGANWTIKTYWYDNGQQEPVHADHHMFIYPTSNRLYSANDGGLDISTDGGNTWTFKGSGLHITQFYRISTSQTDEYRVLCGAQDNSSFLRKSSAFGMTLPTGDGMDQAINPSRGDTMFTSSYYGNISRSYNGGLSWSGLTRPEAGGWVTPYVIDPNNHNTLVGGFKSVWKSTNNGSNWTKISNFTNSNNLTCIHVAPANSNYIYTALGTTMWRTTNGGTNWSTLTLPTSNITTITSNPDDANEIWASFSNYSSNAKVYYSTNGGTNWTNISSSLPNVPANVVTYEHGSNDRVWVGMDIGVWYREAGDVSWTEYTEGLPNVICNDIEFYYAGNKVRVGTYGRGLWEAPLPGAVELAVPTLSSPGNNSIGQNTSLTLDWNSVTNATSYDVQLSTNNNFISFVINENLTSTEKSVNNLQSLTQYFWRVRAISSSDTSAWSSVWNFTTKDPYCTAGTRNPIEFIQRVEFGNIDKTSQWQSGVAINNSDTTTIRVGYPDTLVVTVGNYQMQDYASAWIDFNQNQTYDSFEKVTLTYQNNAFSAIINLPDTSIVKTGNTRLRVRLNRGSEPTPCDTADYGEIEDYPITILKTEIIKNIKIRVIQQGMWASNKHKSSSVILELRSGTNLMNSTLIDRKPAIIDSLAFATANFGEIGNGDYWLVVRASGYLPLAATSKISLSTVQTDYDFTDSSNKSVGGINTLIQPGGVGPWMMRPGDINQSASVTSKDLNDFILKSNNKNVSTQIPNP